MTTPVMDTSTPQPTRTDDLLFASGAWALTAHGGEVLNPVFAPDPAAQAAGLMERLRTLQAATGRTQVLCGLIPFDLGEPARLRITDQVGFRPRALAAGSSGGSGVGSGAGAGASGATATAPSPSLRAPEDDAYRRAVAAALRSIDAGTVQKVVLSRRAEFALPAGTDPAALAWIICNRLAAANPAADIFRATDADGGLWIGASPEIIADVHSGRFLTHPLAGSLPRTLSRQEAAERLRDSDKDLREHAFVVRHIGRALEGLSQELALPSAPSLFGTDSMWHLGSRIRGELRPGVSALEAAVAIHPTPAVCGTPSAAAAGLIGELEPTGRGFYSGLVGWTDATGDGRWSLVLRGARIDKDCVRLQAGAGIVAGSDPEAEHAETGAKFGTLLRALEGLV